MAKRIRKSARKLTQVAKSRKFHAYTDDLPINLCRLALGGQTVKNLLRLTYEFELDQSRRKWVSKRHASGKPSQKLALTCVDLRVRWPGLYIYFLVHCSSGALHDFFFKGLDKLLCLSLTNRELQLAILKDNKLKKICIR